MREGADLFDCCIERWSLPIRSRITYHASRLDNPSPHHSERRAAVEEPTHEGSVAGLGADVFRRDGELRVQVEYADVRGRIRLQRAAGQPKNAGRNRAHLGDRISEGEDAGPDEVRIGERECSLQTQ